MTYSFREKRIFSKQSQPVKANKHIKYGLIFEDPINANSTPGNRQRFIYYYRLMMRYLFFLIFRRGLWEGSWGGGAESGYKFCHKQCLTSNLGTCAVLMLLQNSSSWTSTGKKSKKIMENCYVKNLDCTDITVFMYNAGIQTLPILKRQI